MTTYRYVREDSLGNGSGSSWSNAAGGLESVPEQAYLVGPNGFVLLRVGDRFTTSGHGTTPDHVFGENSGDVGRPVTVRGALEDTSPAIVNIAGERMREWNAAKRTTEQGRGLFDLTGVSYVTFSHMRLMYMSYVFRLAGSHCYGITWKNIEAIQIQRFLETQNGIGLRNSTVEDVRIRGLSKHAFNMRTGTRYNTYRKVWIDSLEQDGDNFSGGFAWDGDAHGDRVYDCRVFNLRDSNDNDETEFWNADGFATESSNDDFEFHNCWTFNATDAGFDIKSTNTTIYGGGAERCKRSIRSWSPSLRVVGFRSSSPRKLGGTESSNHLWHNDTAGPLIAENCTFLDGDGPGESAPIGKTEGTSASIIRLVGPTYIRQRSTSVITDPASESAVVTTDAQLLREVFDPTRAYGTVTVGATTTADNGAGGAGMVIAKPTVSVGDTMVLHVYAAGSGTINTPSGWTAYNNNYFNSGSNTKQGVFYRIVNGTEPASWTVSHQTASTRLTGAISVWGGLHPTTPIGTAAASFQTTSTTNHTSALLTSTSNSALLVYLTAWAGTATSAPPITELYDYTSSAGGSAIGASYETWSGGVSTPTTQRTIVSSASLRGIVTTIALRPLPA